MSDKCKSSNYLKTSVLENAPSSERANRRGDFPLHCVLNPYPEPYSSYPSLPQVPRPLLPNLRQPIYQVPDNFGYNPQGYGYRQRSNSADFVYCRYSSYNNNEDLQFFGHSNIAFDTPYNDYSTVLPTYPYRPSVMDTTRLSPVFPKKSNSDYQEFAVGYTDTGRVSNTKFDPSSKENDKFWNERPRSENHQHDYNRSEYSSAEDGHSKAGLANYYNDQSKHRSRKSRSDSERRSDKSYKDDSVKSQESRTKNDQSSRRSYREKPDRSRSQEQSNKNKGDKKSHSTSKSSCSPVKRSLERYPSCSTITSDTSIDDYILNEDPHENNGGRWKNLPFPLIVQSWFSQLDNQWKTFLPHATDDLVYPPLPLLKQWYQNYPADLYYVPVDGNPGVVESTPRARKVAETFRKKLIERGKRSRLSPETEPTIPSHVHRPKTCKQKSKAAGPNGSSSEGGVDEDDHVVQELERKQHPRRLHPEMWYNDPGEMNDGPSCRCSAQLKKQGLCHGVYPEEKAPTPCDIYTNNLNKLYHYRISISPLKNLLTKPLTVINHDKHDFLFTGFSLFSHYPLAKLPTCKVIRFNIEHTILYVNEQAPINYTIEELDLFEEFLFQEILELVDLDMGKKTENGCSQFHLLPRWERDLGSGGREVLAMVEVLKHLIKARGLLVPPDSLKKLRAVPERKWQLFVDGVRGMIVTNPGKKPCSVRVDQLDRSLLDVYPNRGNDELNRDPSESIYPEIVHFGIRPSQLSYAGNPEYKKLWRDHTKCRNLLANMAKPSYYDKRNLKSQEARLQEIRTQMNMKRGVTIALSSEGFHRTGLMCDVVQHAMLMPVLIRHLRFHSSLDGLEKKINYKFKNRSLLQLALTHSSYCDNFGTNPDHARNSLTNCGIRQPEYGDRKIHYMNEKKRGSTIEEISPSYKIRRKYRFSSLFNIMSQFGKKQETKSSVSHNERLEFLGDAVVQFIATMHLFKIFTDDEEGTLTTFRTAVIANQHFTLLAKKLDLAQYMLYTHGSDLRHILHLQHAMANCFEALIGALFLDGGFDVADRVFASVVWKDHTDSELLEIWTTPRLHPLQEQEPGGDRQWLERYPYLQKLAEFEKSTGIQFTHIRLLARAFTDQSIGYTNLTLGSNQRLEFLGDSVLQLISSEYLYKHFPGHHEGHLSLLRSTLVNNKTQAMVCDDLSMSSYAAYHDLKTELKTKDKADLLEAFLGALYIDKGMAYCISFCWACLFPRLEEFIMTQEWNDPKSKLQQCCLTLRTMDNREPDIPIYKVINCIGPTNTRKYYVAVYFRKKRLASARGPCIKETEMNAARKALKIVYNLFPHLDRQKRVLESAKRLRRNAEHGKSDKADCDKNRSEDLYADPKPSTSKQVYIDNNQNNLKQRNKGSPDKFCTAKDDDKLPLAYRLDRFNNKRKNYDSDSVSSKIDVSLIDLIDMESDISSSDDSVGKLVIDSDAG